MMYWKIGVTTKCGAKCLTCPCHLQAPRTMSVPDFCKVVDWIESVAAPVDTLHFNNIGDLLCLADAGEYLSRIAKCCLRTSFTTNGLFLTVLPMVDTLVVSFNGGTLESHHAVTGLDSERVLRNIQGLYPQMAGRNVEIHCLICDLNAGTETNLLKLFDGFPGRIRVSYKCENQFGADHTLSGYRKPDRVFCDYLDSVVIDPSGKIIQCAHDFGAETDFGRAGVGSMRSVWWNAARTRVRSEHACGQFKGLCERCNYNVPLTDQLVYLK